MIKKSILGQNESSSTVNKLANRSFNRTGTVKAMQEAKELGEMRADKVVSDEDLTS